MKFMFATLIVTAMLICGCESDGGGGHYDTGGSGSSDGSSGTEVTQSSSSTTETTLYIDSPPVTINVENVNVSSTP